MQLPIQELTVLREERLDLKVRIAVLEDRGDHGDEWQISVARLRVVEARIAVLGKLGRR